MTVWTKKELAEHLDIPLKSVGAYCAPSKRTLITNEDNKDLIDDSIIQNKLFIEKKLKERFGVIPKGEMRNGNGRKKKNQDSDTPTKPTPPPPPPPRKIKEGRKVVKPKKEPLPEPEPPELSEQAIFENEYNRKTKELKLAKLEREVELRDLEIERKKGDFIKTEDAINLFTIKSEEYNKVAVTQIERAIKKICEREEIPRENAVRYVAMVPNIVNEINSQVEVNIKELE